MSGIVFTDPLAAMLCYYGLHHVLCSFDLSDHQRAVAAVCLAQAKRCAVAGGVVLYPPLIDLPDVPESE